MVGANAIATSRRWSCDLVAWLSVFLGRASAVQELARGGSGRPRQIYGLEAPSRITVLESLIAGSALGSIVRNKIPPFVWCLTWRD